MYSTVCPGSSDPFYIASLLYKMGHYFLDIQYKDCFCIADSGDQVPEQEEGEDRDPHLGVRGPGEPKSQLKAGRTRDKQSVDQQDNLFKINNFCFTIKKMRFQIRPSSRVADPVVFLIRIRPSRKKIRIQI